jgi:hypothetical protein
MDENHPTPQANESGAIDWASILALILSILEALRKQSVAAPAAEGEGCPLAASRDGCLKTAEALQLQLQVHKHLCSQQDG